jgi:hypothetical protein
MDLDRDLGGGSSGWRSLWLLPPGWYIQVLIQIGHPFITTHARTRTVPY